MEVKAKSRTCKATYFRSGFEDVYVLDQHDRHFLRGGKEQDLILVSVFNPPLRGDERHNLNDGTGSAY